MEALSSPSGEKTLDIYPIGKGKRILLSLADYFLCFIFAIFIFTVAAFPLARTAVQSNRLEEAINANTSSQITLLYRSQLLSSENESQTDFSNDIAYTQKKYVVACLSSPENDNPFYTFYCGILGKSLTELNALLLSRDSTPFFEETPNSSGFLPLLPTYQNEFAPLLDEKNSLTSAGEADYEKFSSSFFLPFYKTMVGEIETGSSLPEASPLRAYRAYSQNSLEIQNQLDRVLIITLYATFVFCELILFLLVPLVNSTGQTLGQILLREVRLGDNNLAPLSRGERSLLPIYHFVLDLSFVPFLPLAYISSISNLFNLPVLGIFALVSLLFALASLVVLLTNKFNQDLLDVASRSVVVDDVGYLEIEKARHHGK